MRNDLTAHSNTKATGSVLGHVTLSDSVSDTFNNSESVAATPHAVKIAYDKAADARSAADSNRAALNDEVTKRSNADKDLSERINERVKTDEVMSEDISTLKSKAHTHDNKEVLDGISSTDIEKWH